MNIATITNGRTEAPAPIVNGQPITLIETIEHEALAYRAWNTQEGDFLASSLERLAQLFRWTGAANPAEHEARMEVWDAEIAERHFERGYSEGLDVGRREARRHIA
jgi:hypothetical protein